MNIVLFGIFWIGIGLLSGVIVNWVTEAETWPWFWVDLLTGFVGASLFGYFVPRILFGATAAHNAYSLIFALFGAALLLAIGALLRHIL